MNAVKMLGGVVVLVLLAVVSLLLPVYFVASSRSGSALLSGIMDSSIHGKARVNAVWLDPVDGLLGICDLEMSDGEGRPVVALGAAWVVPGAWDGSSVDRLRVDRARLWVRIDEDGKVNLDGFFKEEPGGKPPSTPEAFLLKDFRISRSGAVVEGPLGTVKVDGFNLSGSVSETAQGVAAGNVEALLESVVLSPATKDVSDYLSVLLGASSTLGPLAGGAHWDAGHVELHNLSLAVAGALLTADGHLDTGTREGRLNMSARQGEDELFSLAAHRSAKDWGLSAMVNRLALPAGRLADRTIPAVELSGLRVNAYGELLEVTLNRLSVSQVQDKGTKLDGLSVSSSLRFESATPLEELAGTLSRQADPWDSTAAVLSNWKKGEWIFSLLIDDVAQGETSLIHPLRLKANARPVDDGGVKLHGQLVLHPLGSVTLDFQVHKKDREGRLPYSLELTIDSLDLATLVAAADLPGMVKRMASGTLNGKISLFAEALGASRVKVSECHFKLVRPDGGSVTGACPPGDQIWDFSEAPSFSYFTKEVKFGEGVLKLEMN